MSASLFLLAGVLLYVCMCLFVVVNVLSFFFFFFGGGVGGMGMDVISYMAEPQERYNQWWMSI